MKNRKIKIGLALGGGGARGIAHVGVLKILEQNSIPIDCIAGTSMGSVIGAMYAFEPDSKIVERRVREYYSENGVKGGWLEFLSRDPEEYQQNFFMEMSYYFKKRYMALSTLAKTGLEDEETLRGPLVELLPDIDIQDLKIPFSAVAVDLTEGKDAVFREGALIDAVYASSSIEGVFPPLEIDGLLFSDGGPIANVPVEACRQMGADFVIAVYLPMSAKREEQFNNGLEIILRADHIAVTKLTEILVNTSDIAVVPDLDHVHWSAFQKIDECIQEGEIAATILMDEIKKRIKSKELGLKWYNRMRKGVANLIYLKK
ncbi:MAG: hypothetical protein GY855_00815 [candidate division Zixibacteria bacterium]|nr:hypothetical protein [candidate division Zixibacteria bacterium]